MKMKIGLSSYSLVKALNDGRLDILSAIDWAKENGAEHFEIVPSGFDVYAPGMPEAIAEKAAKTGIELSSFTVGANFILPTEAERRAEIERVKKDVDIAVKLGVKRMRHDAGWRDKPQATLENFDRDLPAVAVCCAEVADYAAQFGIVTSVENHGYHFQGSERVRRLVNAVNRSNYRTTIDVGNFLFADDEPVAAVRRNIDIASMIHFKDFFRRSPDRNPGEGWSVSPGGYFLRGTITGHGDINLSEIARIIKGSGYDGFISIEFEGMEDCFFGCRVGLANAKRFFAEA